MLASAHRAERSAMKMREMIATKRKSGSSKGEMKAKAVAPKPLYRSTHTPAQPCKTAAVGKRQPQLVAMNPCPPSPSPFLGSVCTPPRAPVRLSDSE
eukprot:6210322-Pleurochrysis_carterae.AAC.3